LLLYLIRHAHKTDDATPNPAFGGHPDPPLSIEGQHQAALLARRLSRLPIQRMLSSDLTRTMETAKPIAHGLGIDFTITPALREIDMGDVYACGWEGVFASNPRFYHEFRLHQADIRYPNGECGADVLRRVLPVLDELRETGVERAAVVTHGGVIMAVASHVLGLSIERRFAIQIDYASITTIACDTKGSWRLINLNDTAHLSLSMGADL
jgi:broad specificity phosphatase PhoE